jgi:hypothetical protein
MPEMPTLSDPVSPKGLADSEIQAAVASLVKHTAEVHDHCEMLEETMFSPRATYPTEARPDQGIILNDIQSAHQYLEWISAFLRRL